MTDRAGGYADPLLRPQLEPRPGSENGSQVRLAEALLAHADSLAAACTDAMLADPFWKARFGERARRHSLEDAGYHVSYLAHALWFYSPSVMSSYAGWLQKLLVHRGMCSLHIAQTFSRLGDAIRALDLPDSDPAFHYLDAGVEGLTYAPPAGDLQANRPRILQVAARHLQSLDRTEQARLEVDLSYVIDALAWDRPDFFSAHVRWTVRWDAQRDLDHTHSLSRWRALQAALEETVRRTGAARIVADALDTGTGR